MWFSSEKLDIAAIDELEKSSDRAVGVIAGAMVDAWLTDTVRRDLHRDDEPYSKEIRRRVFNPDGPLGSFSAKVNVAYLVGFFTPEAHADLETFGRIRNRFAHFREHNTFDTDSVRALCENLKLIDKQVAGAAAWSKKVGSDTVHYMDAVGLAHNKVTLHLVNYPDVLKTPKGRFVSTAKLFCAAFTLFSEGAERLTKPIL